MMHAPMKDKNGKTRTDRPDLADTKKLYQWAFSSFKLQPGADVKEPVAQIKVKCSFGKDKVNLLPEKELSVLLPSEVNASSIIKTPNIPKELTAPVKKGQVVGTATLTLANEKIGEINLIAE
jgi:D-alanyl-D-alanine carboxypeptidase (penicillin-binding protein 5/6)